MTPRAKAEELFITYLEIVSTTDGRYNIEGIAKQCALIAVDEIIKERHYVNEHYQSDKKLKFHIELELSERLEATRKYWKEVRNEIEKL